MYLKNSLNYVFLCLGIPVFDYEDDPVYQYLLWEFVTEEEEDDAPEPQDNQYEVDIIITIEEPPDRGSRL